MVVLLGRFELPSTAPETGVLSIELQEHKNVELLNRYIQMGKGSMKITNGVIYLILILIFFKIVSDAVPTNK